MADDSTVEFEAASGTDYANHLRMYENFLRLTKYAVAAIVITLVLMAIFLV